MSISVTDEECGAFGASETDQSGFAGVDVNECVFATPQDALDDPFASTHYTFEQNSTEEGVSTRNKRSRSGSFEPDSKHPLIAPDSIFKPEGSFAGAEVADADPLMPIAATSNAAAAFGDDDDADCDLPSPHDSHRSTSEELCGVGHGGSSSAVGYQELVRVWSSVHGVVDDQSPATLLAHHSQVKSHMLPALCADIKLQMESHGSNPFPISVGLACCDDDDDDDDNGDEDDDDDCCHNRDQAQRADRIAFSLAVHEYSGSMAGAKPSSTPLSMHSRPTTPSIMSEFTEDHHPVTTAAPESSSSSSSASSSAMAAVKPIATRSRSAVKPVASSSSSSSFSSAVAAKEEAALPMPEVHLYQHHRDLPFGDCKFTKRALSQFVACMSPESVKSKCMDVFKLASRDQLSVHTAKAGYRFVQAWPCDAAVGKAAVEQAASIAPFSGTRTRKNRRKKRCPVAGCGKALTNIDRHIKQHFKVCSVCLVPGCGRVFNGADTNLDKHVAEDHLTGAVKNRQ